MTSRILIVDDTPVVLDFLEFVFARQGFEVVRAASGFQALELAVSQRLDVLLVDVLMPGMDGLEVCRQLRAAPETSRLPILLYSAAVREEIQTQARAAGADEFLGKTLNHGELVDRVRDWLAVSARPGGLGEPPWLELALDLLDLLQVELVWLLAQDRQELHTLAAASERGEQEALRFHESIGSGPLRLGDESGPAALLRPDRVRLAWPVAELASSPGGARLAAALSRLGIRGVSICPLHAPDGARGALLFAAPRTLGVPRGWARAVAVAARYAALGLTALPRPRAGALR